MPTEAELYQLLQRGRAGAWPEAQRFPTLHALTIYSTWAWAIEQLGRRIENRTSQPPLSLDGALIALHAGRVGARQVSRAPLRNDQTLAAELARVADAAERAGLDPEYDPIRRVVTAVNPRTGERVSSEDRLSGVIFAVARLSWARNPPEYGHGAAAWGDLPLLARRSRPWAETGQWGICFHGLTLLPHPVPARGWDRFWVVPDGAIRELAATAPPATRDAIWAAAHTDPETGGTNAG